LEGSNGRLAIQSESKPPFWALKLSLACTDHESEEHSRGQNHNDESQKGWNFASKIDIVNGYSWLLAAFHDIIAEKTMGYPLTLWLPLAIAITRGLVYNYVSCWEEISCN
jgi:hypothetical protein